MVDYSKWDALDDDDAAASASLDAKLKTHRDSIVHIGKWLKLASRSSSDDEIALTLRFISSQHAGIHRDNVLRAPEIIALLETGTRPPLLPLLLLFDFAREKLHGAEETDAEKQTAKRVCDVSLGAINTLCACERYEGGAHALFAELKREPEGEVAKKYRALGFAKDCLEEGQAPPEEPKESFCKRFGKAMLWQLGLALIPLIFSVATTKYFGPERVDEFLRSVAPPLAMKEPLAPVESPVAQPQEVDLLDDTWDS